MKRKRKIIYRVVYGHVTQAYDADTGELLDEGFTGNTKDFPEDWEDGNGEEVEIPTFPLVEPFSME